MAGRRHLCAHSIGLGVQRPGAFAEYVALPMTNIWHHWPRRRPTSVAAIFDPFGNAVHTALTFPVLGEDVLVTGAGPIGCMAVAVVRHAGARHVVVSDLEPLPAASWRAQDGCDARRSTRATADLDDVQRELGHDRGLRRRRSRCPATRTRSATVLPAMAHGGRIALLGIQTGEVPIDFTPIVFNMLTLKGIYGREMYETWYQMTVMVQSGLDISPVITHRSRYRDFEEAFAIAASGESGKVHTRLDGEPHDGQMYGASRMRLHLTTIVYGSLQRARRRARRAQRGTALQERARARVAAGRRTSRSRAWASCSTSAPTTTSVSPTIPP